MGTWVGRAAVCAALAALAIGCAAQRGPDDPYASYVWPPPPDEPRVRLLTIIRGRLDVEQESRFKKALAGTDQDRLDRLNNPHGVEWDPEGRLLVSDSGHGVVYRFDLEARRMDVLGLFSTPRLHTPLGLGVGADGTIYVADAGLKKVVALDPDGGVRGLYGNGENLVNPTDVSPSPDGAQLVVVDSKAHRLVVFDTKTGDVVREIGTQGPGEEQFAFPASVAHDREGNVYVTDQFNARVQVFDPELEFLDMFGHRARTTGNFLLPKDVDVDELGWIYVTDGRLDNLQIFDGDAHLLTYIGGSGMGPGSFRIASGVAVDGDRFAVVDQMGKRVQVFRFLGPKLGK